MRVVQSADIIAGLRGGDPLQNTRGHFDDGHVQALFGGHRGPLQPDITAADHQQIAPGLKLGFHRVGIGQTADRINPGQITAHRGRQPAGG